MTTADVSGYPLTVQFKLWLNVTNGSAMSNADYTSTTMQLAQVEQFFSSSAQAQLAALKPFTETPLGAYFDSQWQKIEPAQAQNTIALITKSAKEAGEPINSVTANLPTQGSVIAYTTEGVPGGGNSPGQPGSLDLNYVLNGCQVRFEHGSWTAWWLDTFDLTLSLSTPVPVRPFGFDVTSSAIASNAVFSPDGGWAGIETTLDDFFTALGNFFTNGTYGSDWEFAQSAIEDQTDQDFPLGGTSAFAAGFAGVNSAGPEALAVGFTQCEFSIEHDNTLTFTVTHPLDPGPVVQNANDPAANGQLVSAATLSANQIEVIPSESFKVLGENFPMASATHLTLQWRNTSSGTTFSTGQTRAQISVSGGSPYDINAGANSEDMYTHVATGLQPNTVYTFSARCSDRYTWSKWTENPLRVRTAKTDLVELVLTPPAGSTLGPKVLGSSYLSSSSTQWNCDAVMPSTAPPGTYLLSATQGGVTIASMSIEVVAVLSASLVVIDHTTNQVINSPWLVGGITFYVRGDGFPNGPVDITINGNASGVATAANNEFQFELTAPGDQNSNALFVVEAIGGGKQAQVSVAEIGAPH